MIPTPVHDTLSPELRSDDAGQSAGTGASKATVFVRGQNVHVVGLTGDTPATTEARKPLASQCREALLKGQSALADHDLGFDDVTRVVYLIQDGDAFTSCLGLLREAFMNARPITTIRLVHRFTTDETDIEIEMIALRK